MATVFRPLHATRIDRRRVAQVTPPPNLLLSTLFVATIASSLLTAPERVERPQPQAQSGFRALLEASPTPFSLTDQPDPADSSPKRHAYPIDPLGAPRILFESPEAPFAPVDVAGYDFRGSVQSDDRPAASLALALDEASAFYQAEWPVPQRRAELNFGFELAALLPTLLEVEDVTHRLPTFAPRPFRGQHALYSGTERSSFHALISPLDAVPFAQAQWPVTERPERADAHAIFVVRYETEPDPPFAQLQWPTARRRGDVDTTVAANAGPSLLAETVVLPFAETQWPGAERKAARAQETPQPNLHGTLYVPIAHPFAQNDWETPERRAERFDHNRTNLIGTLAPPPIPFNQNEWLNPDRKHDPHFDAWGQSLQHTTLFVENVKPFNQSDWNFAYLFEPKPIAPTFSLASKLISEGFGLPGLQPSFSVEGLMTLHGASVYGRITLHGLSVEGLMTATHAVDGTFEEGEGHEGSFL